MNGWLELGLLFISLLAFSFGAYINFIPPNKNKTTLFKYDIKSVFIIGGWIIFAGIMDLFGPIGEIFSLILLMYAVHKRVTGRKAIKLSLESAQVTKDTNEAIYPPYDFSDYNDYNNIYENTFIDIEPVQTNSGEWVNKVTYPNNTVRYFPIKRRPANPPTLGTGSYE